MLQTGLCLVPASNHRFVKIVFISQNTDAGGVQNKTRACHGVQSEPSSSENPEKMRARKDQDVAADRSDFRDDGISSVADVQHGFTIRTAVLEDVPAWLLRLYVLRHYAFITPIVPFSEIVVYLNSFTKTRQFAGLSCALRRAGKHRVEINSGYPLFQQPGGILAIVRKRYVASPSVPAGQCPFRFSMTN